MKKTQIVFFIMLILLSQFLYADLIHIGSGHSSQPEPIAQELIGYINSVTRLEVSQPVYGGDGFNLDIMDPTNPIRFQIAPTMVALSVPGAQIGSFSMITDDIGSNLRITHTPLSIIVEKNGVPTTVILDWELGVSWDQGGSPQQQMCLSAGWSMGGNVSEINRSIIIHLVPSEGNANHSIVRIQNANLLFRLSSEYPVKEEGVYIATVIFEVEST